MSTPSVLYDAPGPRARRRAALSGVIATLVVLMLVGLVVKRLADQDQFSGKLWGPILNPADGAQVFTTKVAGVPFSATLLPALKRAAIPCADGKTYFVALP